MGDIPYFDSQEAKQIVHRIIGRTMTDEQFQKPEKFKKLSDKIVQQVLEELNKMKKPFKYIVTCTVNQRDGPGLYSHSSCYFNTDTDTIQTFKWVNEAVFCIVSIYIMALN